MMNTPAAVSKKLKAEDVTESTCENYALNGRSAAECTDALTRCHPTGKNLTNYIYNINFKFIYISWFL